MTRKLNRWRTHRILFATLQRLLDESDCTETDAVREGAAYYFPQRSCWSQLLEDKEALYIFRHRAEPIRTGNSTSRPSQKKNKLLRRLINKNHLGLKELAVNLESQILRSSHVNRRSDFIVEWSRFRPLEGTTPAVLSSEVENFQPQRQRVVLWGLSKLQRLLVRTMCNNGGYGCISDSKSSSCYYVLCDRSL